MKRDEILGVFRSLAMSQGFYGRLLRDINNYPEWGDEFLTELEDMNLKTDLDVVLAVEC